ncbi:MAG: UTP--glucose-1-phosphate uridylyltransferase, partial [Endomicrobium sp.]|nr:UTP--glucose-1-phosphate uridylyltransferase [Endomicrobium sp.]
MDLFNSDIYGVLSKNKTYEESGFSDIKLTYVEKVSDVSYKTVFSYKNKNGKTITKNYSVSKDSIVLQSLLTQEEIDAAVRYSNGDIKPVVMNEKIEPASEEDITFIDKMPQEQQDSLLKKGAQAVLDGSVYFVVPAGGAGSGMNRAQMPQDVKDMLNGKEIFSKSAVPLGIYGGRALNYMDFFVGGAARLIQQIDFLGRQAGKRSMASKNVAAYMTNAEYRDEIDGIVKEQNYYGLNKSSIRSIEQPFTIKYVASIDAVRDMRPENGFSSQKDEDEYFARLAFAANSRERVLKGDVKAAVFEGERIPSGHGDLFHQMIASKELLFMLETGIKYVAINGKIDNSAAKFDEAWLKLFGLFLKKNEDEGIAFQAETSKRALSDSGGAWAKRRDSFVDIAGKVLPPETAASFSTFANNNASGICTIEFIAGLYMKEGQTLEEFLYEYKQAANNPEKLHAIAQRGKDKFPKLLAIKPAKNSRQITITREYINEIKDLFSYEETQALEKRIGKTFDFRPLAAQEETSLWHASIVTKDKMSLVGVYGGRDIDILNYLKMSWEEKKKVLAWMRYLSTRQWDKNETQKLKALVNLNKDLGFKEGEEGYVRDFDDPRLLISLKTYAGNKILIDDIIKYVFEENLINENIFDEKEKNSAFDGENSDNAQKTAVQFLLKPFGQVIISSIINAYYGVKNPYSYMFHVNPVEPIFFTSIDLSKNDISGFSKGAAYAKIASFGFNSVVFKLPRQNAPPPQVMRNVIKQAHDRNLKVILEYEVNDIDSFLNYLPNYLKGVKIGKESIDGIKINMSESAAQNRKKAASLYKNVRQTLPKGAILASNGYYDKKVFENEKILRVVGVRHKNESALNIDEEVWTEFLTDGSNASDYDFIVNESYSVKNAGPLGFDFEMTDDLKKAGKSEKEAADLFSGVAKFRQEFSFLISDDYEFVLTERNKFKNFLNGHKYFEMGKMRVLNSQIQENIVHFQNRLDWNNINADKELLKDFKDFLISIDAWSDPIKRAGMIYAVKRKLTAQARANNGVFFTNQDGKMLNFYIKLNGQFDASQSYYDKMRELAKLTIFADMDENIARADETFRDDMKEIFSEMSLYAIGAPIVISGNTKENIMKRLSPLSDTVKENIVFYSDMGSKRWVWNRQKNDFEEDAQYQEASSVEIPEDSAQKAKEIISGIDIVFDELYADFVKNSYGANNYEETAQKALANIKPSRALSALLIKT